MANRFIDPNPQFGDAQGRALGGGSAEFFRSGTTDQLNTFSDQALTTPNPNPITLDNDGRFTNDVWMLSQNYRVILRDSEGVVQYDIDPVVSGVSGGGLQSVGSMLALHSADTEIGHVDTRSFYDGRNKGGGRYLWDADQPRNIADGSIIVDPSTTGGFDGTPGTVQAYFTAQGTGSGNGCWVLHNDSRASLYLFGAEGDGEADDARSLRRAISFTARRGRTLYIDDGVYMVSTIPSTSLDGDLEVVATPGAIIKSIDTLSVFTGNGALDTFTVTDDWYTDDWFFGFADANIRGAIIDPDATPADIASSGIVALYDVQAVGTEFVFNSGVVTLDAPLPNGLQLRVCPQAHMINLTGDNQYAVRWTGGTFDTTLRGCIPLEAGGGLSLSDTRDSSFRNVRFIGNTEEGFFEQFIAGRSRFGIFGVRNFNLSVTECYFEGFNGESVYDNGGSPGSPQDERGVAFSFHRNSVNNCLFGLAIRRDLRGCSVSGNYFYQCSRGVLGVGGLEAGSFAIQGGAGAISDNWFHRIGDRGCIHLEMSEGVTISGNNFIDYGRWWFAPDVALTSPFGIWVSGAKDLAITGNVFRVVENDVAGEVAMRFSGGSYGAFGTQRVQRVSVSGNTITNALRAYEVASNSIGIHINGDTLTDVTHTIQEQFGGGPVINTSWRVLRNRRETWGRGEITLSNPVAWTPQMWMGNDQLSLTSVTRLNGRAVVTSDGVATLLYAITANMDFVAKSPGQLQIRNFPFPKLGAGSYGALDTVGQQLVFEGAVGTDEPFEGVPVFPTMFAADTDVVRFRTILNSMIDHTHLDDDGRLNIQGSITYLTDLRDIDVSKIT